MDLVSFVIPVYNTKAYLEQCVSSILCQTYHFFEIVLVDDGSTDGSSSLCEDLATKSEKIKVFHKPNGGLSDARNFGIKVATGNYLVFLDSDDFWRDENSLQYLMDLFQETPSCDFIGFNCSYFYAVDNRFVPWVKQNDALSKEMTGQKAVPLLVGSGTFPMSACLKIIKKEFLLANNLFFIKGILSEDIPWFVNLLSKSRSCRFVNLYIYAYRQNVATSITNTFSKKSYDDLYSIVEQGANLVKTQFLDKNSQDAIYSFYAYEFLILLGATWSFPSYERKHLLCSLAKMDFLLSYRVNPKVKLVSFLYKFLGINVSSYLLSIYLKSKM